jgi:hypothetical protein
MPYDDRDDELDQELARLHQAGPPAKCNHCGSTKIIPTAELVEAEQSYVRVPAEPSAMVFKGWESEPLKVRLCGECGYVQLFVKNPARLYAVYLQSIKGNMTSS